MAKTAEDLGVRSTDIDVTTTLDPNHPARRRAAREVIAVLVEFGELPASELEKLDQRDI